MMRLGKKVWLGIGLLCVCALLIFVVVKSVFVDHSAPMPFFEHALRDARVSETVVVHGVPYTVDGSSVSSTSTPVTDATRQKALELAYALTVARRSPILDIEGTSSGKLQTAESKLAAVQKKLVAKQSSAQDKELVAGLYPISFLSALIRLNMALHSFMNSGTDTNEAAYETQLSATIGAGQKDITAFKNAYDAVGHPTFALVGGLVEGPAVDAELQNIADGFDRIANTAKSRSQCIKGDTGACDLNDIAINLPVVADTAAAPSTIPPIVSEIVRIIAPPASSGTLVELSESACTKKLGAPPYFLLNKNQGVAQVTFVGDLYFFKLGERYDSQFFRNLGISYEYYNPLTYYTCLESGQDISRVEAVAQAAEVLHMSTQDVIKESDVRKKLSAALASASPLELHTLLKLYLMLKDNSTDLGLMVSDIVQINNRYFGQQAAGGDPDPTPIFLFSVKSGFYVLFLAYNPSAGSHASDMYTEDSSTSFAASLVPWSKLRTSVSIQKIKHDIGAYLTTHIDPESVAYAMPPPQKAPVKPVPPAGTKAYENNSYGISLFYPENLTVAEQKGTGNSLTVLFGDKNKNEGFQVFVIPYGQSKITDERFHLDEPSGVMNNPVNITIDGTSATEFQSTNQAMGTTREIWFLHGGLLYEVTAPLPLDSWLTGIMKTWVF